MKEIRNLLFVSRVDIPLNPLFEAIVEQAILSDAVLSEAGLRVDSAEIEFQEIEVCEGSKPEPQVQFVLDSLGLKKFSFRSKNIKVQSHLINWADLILVPDLGTEDLLCHFSFDAWCKTVPIEQFTGKGYTGFELFSKEKPWGNQDYSSIATILKSNLPDILGRIKDSYASHLLVKGKVFKNWPSKPVIIGTASVVRRGSDLVNFIKGNILVTDRIGVILRRDVDYDTEMSVHKMFGKPSKPSNDKSRTMSADDIKKALEALQAKMKHFDGTETIKTESQPIPHSQISKKDIVVDSEEVFLDSADALELVKHNASAVVCSRSYGSIAMGVPYLYSCIGATQRIKDNQLIIVDSTRGEVYDAITLKSG